MKQTKRGRVGSRKRGKEVGRERGEEGEGGEGGEGGVKGKSG